MFTDRLFHDDDYDQRVIGKASPFCVQDVIYNTILCRSLEELSWLTNELALRYANSSYSGLAVELGRGWPSG